MEQLGKFLLIERLGRGGMAEVWKARITGPMGYARKVVVKRILPELVEEPRFVEMFIAEARLSSCLNHANVVQVYEFGSVDGEFFLAMEYVHGRDLMAVLRASRSISIPPVGMAAFVAREVCRALAYAHSLTSDDGAPLRLIHRDVSPSNVMLGFDGAVKLLDFGIAKALAETEEERTRAGVLKGKIGYVAPEQLEAGAAIDARADQFSAGVILWEMLAGKRLFKGSSDQQSIELVRRAEVLPPSLSNPEVPPELERICLKMLASDREQRYPSCAEAAAELDEVVLALKWGPERLAQLMRQAFPNCNETQPLPLVPVTPSPSPRALAAEPEPPRTSATASERRRPRRRRWVGMLTMLTFLVGGMTWLMALERTPRAGVERAPRIAVAPPATSAATPAMIAAAPATIVSPPSPARSPTVVVRVFTLPSGARVLVDAESQARGRTPLSLTLERSDVSRTIRLVAAGYRPASVEVTPSVDGQLHFALERERPRARRRPSAIVPLH